MPDRLFKVYINPLQFLEVDEPWAGQLKRQPECQHVLNFICTPGLADDVDSIVSRYKEISTERQRLFGAPAEERILDKLVWPLRHAKSGYVLGNYLG